MTFGRDGGRAPAAGSALLTGARRLATTTVLLAMVPVAVGALTAATLLTAPMSVVRRGRWRLVRLCAFLLVYLLVDLTGLLAAAAVWARHAPGTRDAAARRTAATYALLELLLRRLRRAAQPIFGLTMQITPPIPHTAGVPAPSGTGSRPPVIVLARHAGPGDSFLLLHLLLTEAGLLPHTVLKGLLRFDPCLDVIIGRLPHCFLPPPPGTSAEGEVGRLAGELRPGDALVLFPEGGNFTEHRRSRALASLRRHGMRRAAARAEHMHHVLPPHLAGTGAALAAAPTADVVFVAHTGLDAIDSVRTAWDGIPLRRHVRAHWWHVPVAEIPVGAAAREDWLLAQWTRVDRWIAHQQPPTLPPAPAPTAPGHTVPAATVPAPTVPATTAPGHSVPTPTAPGHTVPAPTAATPAGTPASAPDRALPGGRRRGDSRPPESRS